MSVKKLLPLIFLAATSAFPQSIAIYTSSPSDAPGTVQSVTAFTQGLDNKSVTWSVSPTTTLRGLNPGPSTEFNHIGVYSTATNTTYTLTATSVANPSLTASTTIHYGVSPTPVQCSSGAPDTPSCHPRFLVNPSMIPALKTKAASGTDAMFTIIQTLAASAYTAGQAYFTYSTWNGTACVGGSGPNTPNAVEKYLEVDALYMIQDALVDPSTSNQQKYGCAAHDLWIATAGWLIDNPGMFNNNRFGDSGYQFALMSDYLMGTPYVNSSDIPIMRQYLAVAAKWQVINPEGNGVQPPPSTAYNNPAQFEASVANASNYARAYGNNYVHARIMMLTASALTFDNNTTDDPTIATAGALVAAGVYMTPFTSPVVFYGGSGWNVGDTFNITGGTTTAVGQVTAVSSGAVTAFILTNPGAGYNNSTTNIGNPTATTTTANGASTGTGLEVTITAGNTCGNARNGALCSDGSAPNLNAYWGYVTGGLMYMSWSHFEDPNIAQQSYNAAYSNLSSIPQCDTYWTALNGGTVPCMGDGRGGESVEGYIYGSSIWKLREALNAIHTAGFDDPELYGPQMSEETMGFWDDRYVADFSSLMGLNAKQAGNYAWTATTDGDTQSYDVELQNVTVASSMLAYDSTIGRTDRFNALSWFNLNGAWGGPAGTSGGCSTGDMCGWKVQAGEDVGYPVLWPSFIAYPAEDPTTTNLPTDPHSSLPTDWYDFGNRHVVLRDPGSSTAWTTDANTIFTSWCPITQINHEHEFCGGFDIMSNGEYITKGRTEFNNYNDFMTVAGLENVPPILQYAPAYPCNIINYNCNQNTGAANFGGQWWQGYESGPGSYWHTELPAYASQVMDTTSFYNGASGSYSDYSYVTGASRSMIYLRASHQLVFYDRAATGTNAWDKNLPINTTGAATISGNKATWNTRSGNQTAVLTSLLPGGATLTANKLANGATVAGPYSQLQVGTTEQATCTAANADGTSTDVTALAVWTTSNAAKLTVSAGLITGVATGSASVGCSYGGSLPGIYSTITVISGSSSTPSFSVSEIDTTQQPTDWELFGQAKIDAGAVTSTYFLTHLQWGATGFTPVTPTSVSSSSGNVFDGALTGTTLLMFHRNRAETFTTVTYPASGATTQYVADLTPETAYSVSGAGAPSTATTDNAGVLTFAATGTGNITISPSGVTTNSVFLGGNAVGFILH